VLGEACKGRIDIRIRAAVENNNSLSEIARRLLHVFGLPLRTVLFDEQRDCPVSKAAFSCWLSHM
jgi:hypothetical protein